MENHEAVEQLPFDKDLFNAICAKTYTEQSIFFLNAYWAEFNGEANNIWNAYKKFVELDNGNESGTSLDSFNSNRLLEALGQTMTAIKFREEFGKLDQNFDKKMGPMEYFVYRFKIQIKELLSRPQGTDEQLEEATRALQRVQDEIHKIESEKKKLEELASGEGFKATKAKNELAQLLSRDQLPLNKAQIEAKLAVKKAQQSNNISAQGKLWWISKQLEESAKYKPKSNLKKSEIWN
jgi:hypothetical protein